MRGKVQHCASGEGGSQFRITLSWRRVVKGARPCRWLCVVRYRNLNMLYAPQIPTGLDRTVHRVVHRLILFSS